MAESYDVVIAGGAVMGSSTAYHLATDPDFQGRVLVVEKDFSYARCATTLSAGSIRQQFSTRINIEISLFGIAFIRGLPETLAVDGEPAELPFREGGYLFLASPAGITQLKKNHDLQTELGADILFLEPAALRDRFPWLDCEGVAAGCWGRSGEGWFDGYTLLQAFRRKARSLGVTYREASVTGLDLDGGRVTGVSLDDGERIACGAFVNSSGIGGAAIARLAGLEIPVVNRKRCVFTFDCREELPSFPLLIDSNGVYVRPEGSGYICGTAPPPERDPDFEDFEVEYGLFEEIIWPSIAGRVPAFEAIKPGRAWAGFYDVNLFDQNPFVGPAPEVPNFYLANGFSGHGLQKSPAVGRGLSELIVHGAYRSLDLSPLGVERLSENRPLVEKNVV